MNYNYQTNTSLASSDQHLQGSTRLPLASTTRPLRFWEMSPLTAPPLKSPNDCDCHSAESSLVMQLMSELCQQPSQLSVDEGSYDQICHYLPCLQHNLVAKQEINRKWGQITVSVNISDSWDKGLSACNRFFPFTLSLSSREFVNCW